MFEPLLEITLLPITVHFQALSMGGFARTGLKTTAPLNSIGTGGMKYS